MKLEVQVSSKENIKPSSPTPGHLRYHPLSFLDQINSPSYFCFVHFYELNGGDTQPETSEISGHLKKSLAEVLTLFYPLAGRLKDNLYVHCNDEGIAYLEARVNKTTLSDLLDDPIPGELTKLVPFEGDVNEFSLGVQLNIFECGGVAIGISFSHKLTDGLSMLMFIKAWAATSRRALGDHQAEIEPPQFVSATFFPPKIFTQHDASFGMRKNKVTTKRFVFDAANIEDLRAKYVDLDKPLIKRPSRVESLSAFLWSRIVAASKDDDHVDDKLYRVMNVVNLRPLFNPPLPQSVFGNLVGISITSPTSSGAEYSSGFIKHSREQISNITDDYVKKLHQCDEHLGFLERYADVYKRGESTVTSMFSSICKFPLYDSDFGWGRPTYVGVPAFSFANTIVFVDPKEGGGIEVHVCLREEVMVKFERDPKLLSRLSLSSVGSGSIKKPIQTRSVKSGSGGFKGLLSRF
ncbi:stemmadenine O-acetyltransferase-like [Rosa rugosa]|uniref:stemmadenine O-acetyltransferase-like n=1 Tax=Rosa rugosa TaxID=74645 RepID=UPI002B40E7D3|nr:stemmadenine O-acetyltransferase-like [Rosa rugosa]